MGRGRLECLSVSVDACAAMVSGADPDRYASAMCVASLGQRADLMALYAFNIEVARAPWVTQEEMIAEMRLQWWKDAIAEIYEQKTVRKHEVVSPLAEMILTQPDRFPRVLFDGLIEARRFDIYRQGHSSREGFYSYLSDTSGNLMELAARVLGAQNLEPFKACGRASGLANLLVALPELYERGKDPVPLGEIDRNALIEGRVSENNARIIKELAQEGLTILDGVDVGDIPKSARPALLAGWRAKGILERCFEAPEGVLRTDFSVSQFKRASSLLWRHLGPGRLIG